MLELKPQLLFADASAGSNVAFHATDAAHGLYHTQQFALRLSREIHSTLGSLAPGVATNDEVGYDATQAMSTYLHETIHWWQHIGSTFGFVYGLNYPVQSHVAHSDLVALAERDGFRKSVYKRVLELGPDAPGGPETTAGLANRIINNHFDLIAFRAFSLGPKYAERVVREGLFESVGHSFQMTYGHTLNILAATVDQEFAILSDPREWHDGFAELKNRKVTGFYYGSQVNLWPLGALEIMEGQARFSQIQYLSYACGHRLDWAAFRTIGMLSGVYVRAFEAFLRLSESDWPADVNDPLVGLFLLVCDLALKPSVAFPCPVSKPLESFVDDLNPGPRFCKLALLIAKKQSMKKAITHCDRSEYESISSDLCRTLGETPPLAVTNTFSAWFDKSGPLKALRREYDDYKFGPVNLVIRHLFAHFLAFQQDKNRVPEFFCWPGAWLAGERVTASEELLFETHGAPFVDKECDDSVFARQQPGREEATLQSTFDDFYHNSVVYDLINQWISEPGPFKYDVGWLAAGATVAQTESFLRRRFESAFGLDPADAEIVS